MHSTPSAATASEESRFDSEAGYAAAIDTLLTATRSVLCIFDRDLVQVDLEQPARCQLLDRILSARPDGRARIVLHDPQPLEKSSPRLQRLLRQHPSATEVRQSPKRLRHLADCFLLGDGRHGVVRFHAEQSRGKVFLDDAEAARPWQQRFDDLWEEALPCLPLTRLGL